MSDNLNWSEEIPPLPTARIWIPPTGKYWLCVLGSWHALWVHWMGKRSLPCQKDCPKYRHARPARWTAYLPCAIPIMCHDDPRRLIGNKPVIVALSPEQADLLRPKMGNYPGPAFLIDKKKEEKNWELLEMRNGGKVDGLPTCPDVLATLYRVWGIIPETTKSDEPPPPADPAGDGQ